MALQDGQTPNALADGVDSQAAWVRRLALVAFAIGVLAYRDSIMDDTFIHLQYARNLRATGQLAFNLGEPSQGATSPLWLLILAATNAGETTARLLSVACGALSVLVFGSVARRVLGRGAWAAAATVAWGGSLWLVRHAPNGMETAAGALSLLAVIDLRLRGGRGLTRDALFGAALATAILVRPEALLLAVVFAVQDARTAWGRARLAVWLPVFALPVLAWLWFAHARTGQLLPVTGAAKSGGFRPESLVWLRVLWRELRVVAGAHAAELVGLAAAAVLMVRLEGRKSLRRALDHPLAPYGVFVVLLVVVYALEDLQVQPRYLILTLPWVVLAGFAAWRRVLGSATRGAAGVAVASLLVGAIFGAFTVYPATRDFARGIREVLKPMALDIAARQLPRAVVASPDIGVLGYFSNARILDLGGLVDPRVQTIVDTQGYDRMLESGSFLDLGVPDFIVDRSPERERYAGHVTRSLHWRPLRTGAVRGLGISRPQTYYYTLYALEPASAFGSLAPQQRPTADFALRRRRLNRL